MLCPFGSGHKPVALAHPDLIAVESGIGYPSGSFAKFRVFESYACMHVYQGQDRLASMSNDMWYDAVIQNAFDPADFTFSAAKDDYLLFLGRIGPGKGTNVAVQIAEATDTRLIVAGPGQVTQDMARTARPISEYVTQVGVVGPAQRAQLLSRAKATLCPSMYLEPFCGVQIESMLSGTPVISTDWGAFAEYNLHGVTGYRCRTFEQFTWAARHIADIQPEACRNWAAANFSLDRVADQYDEYFQMVADVHNGDGWYQERPDRRQMDWLTRYHPNG
jgi:glycosyltransferase involved in cell wall biosynthesis